jgi:hypothetical protein
MIRKLFSAGIALIPAVAGAQETGPVMADQFRSDGKIYVVIAVIGIIFAAIILLLWRVEKKLKRLEGAGKTNK